jgi:hypothetical protein
VPVVLIRVLIFLLSATAVGIAVVPILVLIDLLDGGTGYGLCPTGLETCDKPYSTGGEILILMCLALFAVVMGIRLLMRLARRIREDSYQASQ